jgi:hypothetical protein
MKHRWAVLSMLITVLIILLVLAVACVGLPPTSAALATAVTTSGAPRTQAASLAAQRLYESVGFRIASRYLDHVEWLVLSTCAQ